MSDEAKTPPSEVVIPRKNPERLPPTLAVAFTASELQKSYDKGAKKRRARENAIEYGLLPKP